MPLTLDELTEQALQLLPASRAVLADQLVQSLANDDAGAVRQAWVAEALSRRDEIRSGQVEPIPGEQVIADVRRVVGR